MTFARSTFVLLLLLAGCAQVREIGGGERDTTAPELVFADPPNLSTGFTGQRILLRFDEKIKVQDVQQQLLISPPLGEAPDRPEGAARNRHHLQLQPGVGHQGPDGGQPCS
jgi:hypothetical protein